MERAITLAVDVEADPTRVSDVRHFGFGAGYPEVDLGHTAQTWAHILDRLAGYLATGTPQPFFPAAA